MKIPHQSIKHKKKLFMLRFLSPVQYLHCCFQLKSNCFVTQFFHAMSTMYLKYQLFISHTVLCLQYSSDYFGIDFIMLTDVYNCINVFKSIMPQWFSQKNRVAFLKYFMVLLGYASHNLEALIGVYMFRSGVPMLCA